MISEDDRQFLRDAFQAAADVPLEPDDPRYVSFSHARGESIVELLARGIEFSEGGSVQFVCGLPGSGVTTTLKRLQGRLRGVKSHIEHWDPNTAARDFGQALLDVRKQEKDNVIVIDYSLDSKKFARHVRELRISWTHVVYSVPWTVKLDTALSVQLQRLGPIYTVPSIEVRDIGGAPAGEGLDALTRLLRNRLDTDRLLGSDAAFTKLLHASGGNPRDCLRLVHEVIRRATSLPVEDEIIDAAIAHLQNSRLPIPNEAIPFLSRMVRTHDVTLEGETVEALEAWTNARLFLQYRNGREWYGVHPLVRDLVLAKANAASEIATPEPPRAESRPLAQPRVTEPVTLTPEMQITLSVDHYRALRRVRWAIPRGVSALVGPNGSGKTTLLDIPELMRHALQYDVLRALDHRGGPGNLRNAYADRQDRVMLGISLDSLLWQIELSPRGASATLLVGERGMAGETLIFDRNAPRPSASVRMDDARLILTRFADLPEGIVFHPLVNLLHGYRFYQAYDLDNIRRNGSPLSADEHLHPDGRNVFSVLRNWRDRKETRSRWQFVIDNLKAAFPDTFEDLDFEMAGQTVSGRIVAPRPDVRIASYFAANGWLIGLLHLTAVASTEPGGAVAIDELENGLHPHAIRQVIEAMRDWARTLGISIVLATHSPVVLDQFKSEPENLFVMEPGHKRTPMPLDELHNPDWLAHFSLGDLYMHDEFGAQRKHDEPTE